MDHATARILIVDDEPSITEFVSYAMQKEGYETDVASDGETALKLLEEKHYDLFVLDIMLPGVDGYDLCRRIRAKMDTPILFLSARDSELNKVVGLELGADDYLAKPLAYENLWHAPALFFVAANQMILYLPLQKFAQAVSRSMKTHTLPMATKVLSI